MTERFLQIHIPKLNPCCIVWNKQQDTLTSSWTKKKEYICFNREEAISTRIGVPLKLVDKFTYLGSNVSSTENDFNMHITKVSTAAIHWLLSLWKCELSDEIKRDFFQTVVVSILLHGCTTWTLTKDIAKKLDGNCTRMLRAIFKKYWKQHPTKQQLYYHLPPISKTIRIRRARHAGHYWRSKNELIWTSHTDPFTLTCQCWPIYNSSVRTQDVVWKTIQGRSIIGTMRRERERERERKREKESVKEIRGSTKILRLYIYIYIYMRVINLASKNIRINKFELKRCYFTLISSSYVGCTKNVSTSIPVRLAKRNIVNCSVQVDLKIFCSKFCFKNKVG